MFYKVIKRIFDFTCALIGIIGTSPLWIIGIIGILVSDWGPIFYIAHRIGKNNILFKMYKFRSMRVAKAVTEDLMKIVSFHSGASFAKSRLMSCHSY